MILSADTNLFLSAANPDSHYHEAAQRFFEEEAAGKQRLLLCGFVLVELEWP
jgi:predicted nucleic acid-binding protein